jgi:O-antigen/teichoic acid export membrane protein
LTAKKIIQFSLGPVGAAFLGFISLPLIAWFFPVEVVGQLSLFQVSISFIIMLFTLAMHQAYVREYHEVKCRETLLKHTVLPGFILLVLFCFGVFFSPISISNILFDIESKIIDILFLLSVVSMFFTTFLAHVVRMEEKGITYSISQLLPKLLLIAFVGFIIVFKFENTLQNILISYVMSLLITFLIFAFLMINSWRYSINKKVDKKYLKELLKFSLPLVAGGVAYWGLTTMDRFFLKFYSNFNELGQYAIAVSIAGAVSLFSIIFSNIWHPVVYKWIKEGLEVEKIEKVIENMFLAVTLIWTLVGLFAWVVKYLLPADYSQIEFLIIACVSMPLLYMLSETTVVGIGISKRTSFSMLASVVAFLINAFLNYLLIPIYGAIGAAIATVISFFIFFLVRTESSVYLWKSFKRGKLYLVLSLYLICTLCIVLFKVDIFYASIFWIILYGLNLLLFKDRVLELKLLIRQYYKSKGGI